MSAAIQDVKDQVEEHRSIKDLWTKWNKDNCGMLAGYVSWSILTSVVPIVVGLVAISGLFLRSPSAQRQVVTHLSQALQNALTPGELDNLVKASVQHTGLLFVIGILGALWGGSNVGGALSTAFQAIFEVGSRNFFKEKLIDIGMIFIFTALMLVILASTIAGSFLDKLFSGFPLPGVAQFVIGTVISVVAAFLLFASIYLAFPNIQPGLKLANVWRGALVASIVFEILTYIFPIYTKFAHFSKNGAILGAVLLLTAWIYFFSMITVLGAEVVAIWAIREAQAHGESVGPSTQDSVPQHEVLRDQKNESGGKNRRRGQSGGNQPAGRQAVGRRSRGQGANTARSTQLQGVAMVAAAQEVPDRQVQRDPAFWLLAATPLLVATLAGLYELLTGRNMAPR